MVCGLVGELVWVGEGRGARPGWRWVCADEGGSWFVGGLVFGWIRGWFAGE